MRGSGRDWGGAWGELIPEALLHHCDILVEPLSPRTPLGASPSAALSLGRPVPFPTPGIRPPPPSPPPDSPSQKPSPVPWRRGRQGGLPKVRLAHSLQETPTWSTPSSESAASSTSWPTCPATPLPSTRPCNGADGHLSPCPELARKREPPWRAPAPLPPPSLAPSRPAWRQPQVWAWRVVGVGWVPAWLGDRQGLWDVIQPLTKGMAVMGSRGEGMGVAAGVGLRVLGGQED